jgi:N-methylhydantoinase A
VHNVRVEVARVVEKYTVREDRVRTGDALAACTGHRPVVFPGDAAPVASSLFDRSRLPAGARLDGPAVIAANDSTIVVPPGAGARVDEFGTLVLTPAAAH